ncbi:MAG: hypothetical protein IPQ16_13570 [Geobacteraceae bacterium]|nr:hypothetical protein [Geobacteraceae bacterium]
MAASGPFSAVRNGHPEHQRVVNGQHRPLSEKFCGSNRQQGRCADLCNTDSEHRIIVWNSAIEDLTGLRAEEMLGTRRQWEPFYTKPRPVMADIILSRNESLPGEAESDSFPYQPLPACPGRAFAPGAVA